MPQTKGTCALAIQAGSVPYLFWAQPNAAVMATSLTDVTQPSGGGSTSSGGSSTSTTANWSAGLVLCDDNQAIVAAPDGACVSAVSLGSQAFLVAFPAGGNPLNLGAIGLYYVADRLPNTMTTTPAGTFGIWPARAMRAFSALELGALLPAVAGRSGNSLGNMCSIADGTRPDQTPCGINATMAALTNGEITDYFGTVIWPAAFDFAAGSDTPQKFLEFGWGLGAVTGEAFTAVQGTVNASSWNIQASMAAGLFWDVKSGAPLLGGLETEGNLMIGGSAGYASSTTTTESDGWGVTIAPFAASPSWGPPNWGVVPETAKSIDPNWENDVVAQYTFALLFLPDPSSAAPAPLCPGYWVQELIKYGNTNAPKYNPSNYLPNNLDPGSGCWRIVYVVLAIQTYADLNNDPPTYTYKCSDPRLT